MLTPHHLSFLVIFFGGGGLIDSQSCNYYHLPSDVSSKFHSSMTIFHHKLLTREGMVSIQWMNSSIIHDSIRSLIHKKCHPRSYHHDINYHTTLKLIIVLRVGSRDGWTSWVWETTRWSSMLLGNYPTGLISGIYRMYLKRIKNNRKLTTRTYRSGWTWTHY